jgi:hypothetical protein
MQAYIRLPLSVPLWFQALTAAVHTSSQCIIANTIIVGDGMPSRVHHVLYVVGVESRCVPRRQRPKKGFYLR